MSATPEKTTRVNEDTTDKPLDSGKVDPRAPAGSPNSLGEESIRDGRPATDDQIIEAIDEEDPATVEPSSRHS